VLTEALKESVMAGEKDKGSEIDQAEFLQLRSEFSEVKIVLNKVVEALNRLAVFEERQQNVAVLTNKILERVERIEERQHRADIDSAVNASTGNRLQAVEDCVKEMHLDTERHKASFATLKWLVATIWAVLGSGGALWLIQAITSHLGK
jgi:hypothetical protein